MKKNVSKQQLRSYETTDMTVEPWTIGGMIVGALAGVAIRSSVCQSGSTSSWCTDASGQPSSYPFYAGALIGGLLGFTVLYAMAK